MPAGAPQNANQVEQMTKALIVFNDVLQGSEGPNSILEATSPGGTLAAHLRPIEASYQKLLAVVRERTVLAAELDAIKKVPRTPTRLYLKQLHCELAFLCCNTCVACVSHDTRRTGVSYGKPARGCAMRRAVASLPSSVRCLWTRHCCVVMPSSSRCGACYLSFAIPCSVRGETGVGGGGESGDGVGEWCPGV